MAIACNPVPGPTSGDGVDTLIDSIDDDNITFRTAGVGMGVWDFSKDSSNGKISPAGTASLVPVAGGRSGKALHLSGSGLTGWGAALSAVLDGWQSSFDASNYGGVAFSIKGTTDVFEGTNKVMILARMPDVLPGPGSCCDDGNGSQPTGLECYSAHRVVVDVTSSWREVKITWADFASPSWGLGATIELNPNRIRDILFAFNHDIAEPDPEPISFNVWVDGLRFLDANEKGNVGSQSSMGGSAGSGNIESGGAGAGGEGP